MDETAISGRKQEELEDAWRSPVVSISAEKGSRLGQSSRQERNVVVRWSVTPSNGDHGVTECDVVENTHSNNKVQRFRWCWWIWNKQAEPRRIRTLPNLHASFMLPT